MLDTSTAFLQVLFPLPFLKSMGALCPQRIWRGAVQFFRVWGGCDSGRKNLANVSRNTSKNNDPGSMWVEFGEFVPFWCA